MNYGVRDSNPSAPIIFYTGIEYQHRMRYFTGKQTVANNKINYYFHHQRTDNNLNKIRSEKMPDAFIYAGRFWKDKFNIDLVIDPIGVENLWEKLYNLCSSEDYNKHFRKHLVFDGMWTNWKDIYEKYNVEVLYNKIKE